jgi:hypothetical protein
MKVKYTVKVEFVKDRGGKTGEMGGERWKERQVDRGEKTGEVGGERWKERQVDRGEKTGEAGGEGGRKTGR